MSPPTEPRFPLLALLIGGAGTAVAILGILGFSAPTLAVRLWAPLQHDIVASALIAVGAMLMAVELILILLWLQRRRRAAGSPPASPVTRTRDRG